jgi:hypothetical protein
MGYTSDDDMLNQMTVNGKRGRMDFTKSTAPVHTAGGWHMFTGLAGNPNAGTFPGTDLLFQSCWETSGDGTVVIGPQHGGVVTPATKHLLSLKAMMVAAAGAPWIAMLVDLQGYYRLSTTNVTGTGSRVLINSNTFTASSSSGLLLTYTNDFNTLTKVRFTNSGGALPTGLSAGTDYYLVRVSATTARVATSLANAIAGTVVAFTDAGTGTHTLMIHTRSSGVGNQALFVSQTAPTAGGPNLTASAYDNVTDTPGAGTRAFQGTPNMGAAADAYATRILHSGNATGRFGPFLPLQAADTGVARINSFTWSGGVAYTGTGIVALAIVKPIAEIPLPVTGILTERDLRSQLVSLPKIDDGACLQWLLFGTGATTTASSFMGVAEFGWGG